MKQIDHFMEIQKKNFIENTMSYFFIGFLCELKKFFKSIRSIQVSTQNPLWITGSLID